MRKDDQVGYRFSPTAEELIIYYLMNKILDKTWLVDEAISEINICSYEPEFLPSLAKIKTDDDLVWYFFCPIEYTTAKNKETKRSTGSGFWKSTGKDLKIKDKRGKGQQIGLKKILVYHQGKGWNAVRTPWVIHEYHITCLPHNLRTKYVICQVMYNGEDGDILYGNKSNEPTSHQSLASVSNNTSRAINTAPEFQVEQAGEENVFGMSMDDLVNPVNVQEGLSLSDGFNPNTFFKDNIISPNVQPQTPCDNAYFDRLLSYNEGNFEDVIITTPHLFLGDENSNGMFVDDLLLPMNQHNDPNTFLLADYYNNNNPLQQTYNGGKFPNQGLMMQENRNEHRPKKALSGTFVDSSSDSGSDAESISATSYQRTSSPGSSNVARSIPSCSSTDSCKDLQTSADPSISRRTKESQLTSKLEAKQGTSSPGSNVPSCSSTDSCKDLQTSADPSISTMTKESQLISKQEVKQGTARAVDVTMEHESSSLVKTEKKGLFMIIGFILLLALIISVY